MPVESKKMPAARGEGDSRHVFVLSLYPFLPSSAASMRDEPRPLIFQHYLNRDCTPVFTTKFLTGEIRQAS